MAKKGNPLAVASKAIDPTLDALFASSAGPVKAPPKTRYAASHQKTAAGASGADGQDVEMQDGGEVLSEISQELDYGDDDDDNEDAQIDRDEEEEGKDAETTSTSGTQVADVAAAAAVDPSRTNKDRKRKRKDDNEDLEGKYLAELARQDEREPSGKRQKPEESGSDDEEEEEEQEEEKPPLHESLTKDGQKADLEKAARTVFLANVSSEAISSKTAKKTLMKHLSSVLDAEASPPEKVESLRFRSVAFGGGPMPKRAAFITKSLMEATTKSTNAYAVVSTAAAARKVAAELNGSEVLGRHLRVDSVAHPSPMDHRRCVFVGNLGFVDDETVLSRTADGETVQKKRTKVPADVDEGLWRTFGTQGRVENVRVVRDPKTRVGKGFAYVQFYDGNDVEAALLLDGKKFPPMLPRALRVTRAKDPRKTSSALEKARAKADAADKASGRTRYVPKATPAAQAAAGRSGKLLGRAGGARHRRGDVSGAAATGGNREPRGERGALKTPQQVVFEGRRASSRDALPKDLKAKKGKGKGKGKGAKPAGRGARRASAWKQGKK